mgnify:CR=1 FL=1
MVFLQAHTLNTTPHPAPVAPLVDDSGSEIRSFNSFDLDLTEHNQTTLIFDLDLKP